MHYNALIVHLNIHAGMTNVKNKSKDVITDEEVDRMLTKADTLPTTFFQLRAKATLALLETGKRRSEIAALEKADITSDSQYLYVRFTVVKKRKKNLRSLQRVKKFDKKSKWAGHILAYLEFLANKYPDTKFVFPRGCALFGKGYYLIVPEKRATGQEIWRIVKSLNPDDWPHQHRERRAVKVIRADEQKYGEAKLETVYRVKNVLDLERETTAYNYIRRFETQRAEEEDETIA